MYTKRFQWHINTYVEQKLKKNAHYIFYLHIFISWKKKGGGGCALNIFSIFYTHHRIPNKHMMTINFDTITNNNNEVIYVIKTVMKYHLKKIDMSFHQPLPNMVQHLFADVVNDAIWFMNIHEQNHPWFLAMWYISQEDSNELLCYSIFSFMCMFCRFVDLLFVLLYFFFWPLCCLFFFDMRILITPLVSIFKLFWWRYRNQTTNVNRKKYPT